MTKPADAFPTWQWFLLPAVAMSLGWGLRGYIGGGPLGAMIPGAMIGLVLCLLLQRERDAGVIAAFAAIGVGFGGQETYGQTVGLSLKPETYAWAITGFALKGAIWGLLGGAALGIALAAERLVRRDVIIGFALMLLGTWVGWKLINEPKLIYFSNRYDQPRPEIWAGLLIGGILLLVWMSFRARVRLPWVFALWGGIGGGVGFAAGAALQAWGRGNGLPMPPGWWKVMEFTFGALLGLGYGYCAWRHRAELPPKPEAAAPSPLFAALACAVVAVTGGMLLGQLLPTRFDFTIAGAMLLSLALLSDTLSRQIAVTLTYCAYSVDLLRNRPDYPSAIMWVFVVISTVAVAVFMARVTRVKPVFLLLMLSAVGISLMKTFLPPPARSESAGTQVVFVVMAVIVTFLVQAYGRPEKLSAASKAAQRGQVA